MKSSDKSCNCGNQVFGKTKVHFLQCKLLFASLFYRHSLIYLLYKFCTYDHLIVSCNITLATTPHYLYIECKYMTFINVMIFCFIQSFIISYLIK